MLLRGSKCGFRSIYAGYAELRVRADGYGTPGTAIVAPGSPAIHLQSGPGYHSIMIDILT
jgi:hypothetical protein